MRRILFLFAAASVVAVLAEITPSSFRHRFISRELPGANVGIGASALVDLDRDGDLDFAVLNRGDRKLYWFEQKSKTEWVRHLIANFHWSSSAAPPWTSTPTAGLT